MGRGVIHTGEWKAIGALIDALKKRSRQIMHCSEGLMDALVIPICKSHDRGSHSPGQKYVH